MIIPRNGKSTTEWSGLCDHSADFNRRKEQDPNAVSVHASQCKNLVCRYYPAFLVFGGGAVKKGKIIETDRRKRGPLKIFSPFCPLLLPFFETAGISRNCGRSWGTKSCGEIN